MFVIGLLFLDHEVRAKPLKVLDALADLGSTIATLYLMCLAVTVIDVCLTFTGFSKALGVDVLGFLTALDLGGSGSVMAQFVALLVAIILGMGMPAVPAYINAALLMGPLLVGLGIATFTAHIFIFYFAVASAISPPVALAAFTASTITEADPMKTGIAALRVGIVMFVIPFVFAFYPELLLITPAITDPSPKANGAFLRGYDGTLHWAAIAFVMLRVIFALYLLASALAHYDSAPLPKWEVAARLELAVLVVKGNLALFLTGIGLGAALIALHTIKGRRSAAGVA